MAIRYVSSDLDFSEVAVYKWIEMQLTEFSVTERGDLRITLTVQGRIDLDRLITKHPDWDDVEIFIEMIDHQLTNGWYVILPDQIRTQTKSLLLTNAVTYDDAGNIINVGDTYWYPKYRSETYAASLFKLGYITFERGNYVDPLP